MFPPLRHRWSLSVAFDRDGAIGDSFGLQWFTQPRFPTDPEELCERLTPHQIKGKAGNHWSHPNLQGRVIKEGRASGAARDFCLPLWEVLRKNKNFSATILHNALAQIALARSQQIDSSIREALELDSAALNQPDWDALRSAVTLWDETQPEPSTAEAWTEALERGRDWWIAEMEELFRSLAQRELPAIKLPSEEIAKAIPIFEAINRGGVRLSTFDPPTAKLARNQDSEHLPERLHKLVENFSTKVRPVVLTSLKNSVPKDQHWQASTKNIAVDKDGDLTKRFKKAFLSTLSLLASAYVEENGSSRYDPDRFSVPATKDGQILSLTPQQVEKHLDVAAHAVLRAWAFLQIRCGIPVETALRNELLIIPLALCLTKDAHLTNSKRLAKLEYWYWSSVLTKTYTESQNANCIHDAKTLLNWCQTTRKTPTPEVFESRRKKCLKDEGYSDKACLTRTSEASSVSTDVGRYLLQFALSSMPHDFDQDASRLMAWITDLEDHHIIPLSSQTTLGQSARELRNGKVGIGWKLNSPLNRALISHGANRTIRDMNYDKYVQELADQCCADHGLTRDPGSPAGIASIRDGEIFQSGGGPSDESIKRFLESRFSFTQTCVTNRFTELEEAIDPAPRTK